MSRPPRFFAWLLRHVYADDGWHTPLGDFEEWFHELARGEGLHRARWWYRYQVLNLLPRRLAHLIVWNGIMLTNYLIVAVRNLRKNKAYAFINIVGLSVGIAACVLMLLYVHHQTTVDHFHEKANHIYRVVYDGTEKDYAIVHFPVAANLTAEYPQIAHSVRFYPATPVLAYEDQSATVPHVLMADASVFEVFDIPFVMGNPASAFNKPNSIVLTEAQAVRLFGDTNPIGQTLSWRESGVRGTGHTLEVTGVVADISDRSHLRFNALVNFAFLQNVLWPTWDGFINNWTWTSNWTYLHIPDPGAAAVLAEELDAFVARHYEAWQQERFTLALQPLTSIHLHSQLSNEMQPTGNATTIYLFLAVAVLVLLIACINFVNLATARSTQRAREVGLRKVLGAYRSTLIQQFLGEALLLTGLAILLALALVYAFLPVFNLLTGIALTSAFLSTPGFWLLMAGIGLTVGVVAGSYPAFYLSGFRPIAVLKGTFQTGLKGVSVRSALVVTQFVVSMLLLISVVTLAEQQTFIQTKDLGYASEPVIRVVARPELQTNFDAYRQALLQHPNVLETTAAWGNLTGSEIDSYRFYPEGYETEAPTPIAMFGVASNFFEVMDIALLEGRSFSDDRASDQNEAFILNEAAVRHLGWDGEIAGRPFARAVFGGGVKTGTVVGVVRDFHFQPLHAPIQPLVLEYGGWHPFIKLRPENLQETLAFVEATTQHFAPAWPFEFEFLDEEVGQAYAAERQLGLVLQAFAALALVIACLGLFGLAAFTAEQRTKEIGIRKTMGASVSQIVVLLSGSVAKLVVLAFILAAPVGYWVMKLWLEGFAYHIELGITVFLLAGSAVFFIALATVSYQSSKAALANPIDALRHE